MPRAWIAVTVAIAALIAVVIAATSSCGSERAEQGAETVPAETGTGPTETTPPPPTETTPPPPPETTPPPQPVPTTPPPPNVPFAWTSAGALVWHENDVDPALLAGSLNAAGFGWVAVFLHDGLGEDPVEADWVYRFRLASGLPVGGWGVLRTAPEEEAMLAHMLLARYHLDFYVANPEVEYEFSGPGGPDPARSGRSQRFVERFRALRPTLAAGVSSYCSPDRHDIDWLSWRRAGFAFLPQAYANDLGPEGAPATCVRSAAGFFPAETIHPTVGMHPGALESLDAAAYVAMLADAGSVGFSVYLAETRMTEAEWQVFGTGIAARGIARAP